MKIIRIKDKVDINLDRNVCCIGYFDALHLGHLSLIKRCFKIAQDKNLKKALITFSPDPMDLISTNKTKHIFSDKTRYNIIKDYGFDYLIEIEFDEKLMKSSPQSFIKNYLNRLNIDTLVCGYDFRFAHKACGTINDLNKYSKADIEVVEQLSFYGKKISSSRIKNYIHKGNFRLCNRLLGFDYFIILKVNKCTRKGNKYLIEAINKYNTYMPKEGKYSNFEIRDNYIYLNTDKLYKKNDEIILYPQS